MNANLQRALNASMANMRLRENENYLMAQMHSRNVSANNLYMDSAMEMRENMFGKPDARRRLIAGVALDTLIMHGEREYEGLRDILLESRYSTVPADEDDSLAQAEAVMAVSNEDPLVNRLREVHESMLAEEKEEEEREKAKAIRNAEEEERRRAKAIQNAEEEERRRVEAAKPVVPNRNAARNQRQAFLNRFKKQGGKRTRKAVRRNRRGKTYRRRA